MPKAHWKESWWIRKIIYCVLALGLTIAVGGGWVSDTQADSWLAQADHIVGILAAVGLGVAATKTHRGSDDPVTHADVAEAARATPAVIPRIDERIADMGMVLNDVRDTIAGLTSSEPHPEPAPAPGIYPKG